MFDSVIQHNEIACRDPRLGQPSPVVFPLPLLEEWATFSASGVTSHTRIASLRLLEYGLLIDAIFEILAKLMTHCKSPTRAPWLAMTTTFVLFLLIFLVLSVLKMECTDKILLYNEHICHLKLM